MHPGDLESELMMAIQVGLMIAALWACIILLAR